LHFSYDDFFSLLPLSLSHGDTWLGVPSWIERTSSFLRITPSVVFVIHRAKQNKKAQREENDEFTTGLSMGGSAVVVAVSESPAVAVSAWDGASVVVAVESEASTSDG